MNMKNFLSQWRNKEREIKLRLRGSYIHKMIGDRLFAGEIWAKNRSALSGGLSLGLFIAFTPTIPFQMLLSAIGAILLGVNLPVAIAACWVTNPLTAGPIYLAAYELGHHLFTEYDFLKVILPYSASTTNHAGKIMSHAFYLWTGSLILASVAALAGNIFVRLIWNTLKKIDTVVGQTNKNDE